MDQKKPRVLLIEDEPDHVALWRTKLSRDGFEIIAALDPKTGLSLAKKRPPDVILLDLMLPGISGFDVLADLKKDDHLKNVPVVALTNLAEEVGFERAKALGATSYVVKAECPPGRMTHLLRQILSETEAGGTAR